MPTKDTNNDLESGSINLLPEDLRAAELKDLKSGRSNESPYQLRAPKKERKQRRGLAWLPFFGGNHWDATQLPTKADMPPLPESGIAKVTTSVPERLRDFQQSTDSTVPLQAVTDQASSSRISVSPTVNEKMGPKRGMKFMRLPSWLGGKPHGSMTPPPSRSAGPSTATPPRHYSLLREKEEKMAVPKTSSTGAPVVQPQIGFVSTLGDVQQASASARSVYVPSSHGGMRWPQWLDIFYIIGRLTSGQRRTHKLPTMQQKPPHGEKHAVPEPKPIVPVMPSLTTRQVASGTMNVMPTTGTNKAPLLPVSDSRKIRRGGFFVWLAKLFAPKPKAPGVTPVIETPRPMAPAPVPPAPPRPVTLSAPSPLPEAPQPLRPIAVSQPDKGFMPTLGSLTIDAVTPPPAPPGPGGEKPRQPQQPITPSASGGPAPTRGGKHDKHVPKAPSGLHLPTKLAMGTLVGTLRDVNLIPGDFSLRSWKQISQMLVLTVIAVGAVSGMAYALLNTWEGQIKSKSAEIDTEIQKFTTDIQVFRAEEPRMTALGARIDLVNQLLSQHIYWTQFLGLLEKYTLPDVYYDGVSATTNGKLSLSAHGSSYETVSRTLHLLTSEAAQEFVTSVSVTGAQRADGQNGEIRVDFIIELTLNPSLFYYNHGAQENQ